MHTISNTITITIQLIPKLIQTNTTDINTDTNTVLITILMLILLLETTQPAQATLGKQGHTRRLDSNRGEKKGKGVHGGGGASHL